MYQQNNNTGALFTYKMKWNDSWNGGFEACPGKCKIGGVEYYIDAVQKHSKMGNPYLLLNFRPVPPEDMVE
jgi:hypothetical protein